MKIDVKMPKLGESLTEGTILKWMKKPGESIRKDEVLLEVSTDKVDSEIPSPASGTLTKIFAEENETVEVDSLLAQIESGEGEQAESGKEKPETTPSGKKEDKKTEDAAESEKPDGNARIHEVVMPKLGESLTEGTVLKWLKSPGDPVTKDETLLEVSTDKVDSEIPSPVDGILKEIVAEENETVEVDSVLARIETSGAAAAAQQPQKKSVPEKKPEKTQAREKSGETGGGDGEIPRKADGRFYSPLVRTIARKEGVSLQELSTISGTGKGGRVSKKDVLAYLNKREAPAGKEKPVAGTAVSETASAAEFKGAGNEMIIPMDAVRKKIAVHMRQSLDTSAHVYSVSECDMSLVMDLMYRLRPEFQKQEGFKLTVTPFILHAVTKALLDFPRLNSSLDDDNIIERKYFNLGIAVAAKKGLIVPVVKNAEERSFRGLARAVNDLVVRTRNNELTLDDVQGATFTITNYGIFGNVIGLPIINQPNVAILGIGAIKKKPVVIESPQGDSIAIRSMCYISMSYDHRIIDGELGGKFMQRLVEYLESFNEDVL